MSTLSTDEHLKGGADRPVFVVSLRPEPGIDPVPALRRALRGLKTSLLSGVMKFRPKPDAYRRLHTNFATEFQCPLLGVKRT